MSNEKHFIQINPAAEADVTKMNEIMQGNAAYIKGVKFTHSEVIEGGSVQFFYDYPEELTPEQSLSAKQLIKEVCINFTTARIATS